MTQIGTQKEGPGRVVPDIRTLIPHVQAIRDAARHLHRLGDTFPAVSKNAARILASIRMIELNIPEIPEDPRPSDTP